MIERLIRANQDYKVALQHEKTLNYHRDKKKEFVLEQINRVDYSQAWGDLKSSFTAEKTFTWLDWLVIVQGISRESFKMSEMLPEQLIQLASNILPDGSGILHKLAREPDTKFEHINQMPTDLFSVSKQEV